jgi:5-amino-6-(5-phosphoribosylamino)uracil reductase
MYIFSNLATSVDGKIATQSRVHFSLGTPADRRLMQVLRKRADAVIIGAGTLRAFHGPILCSGAQKPINVVVSSQLKGLSTSWKFFTNRSTRKILFVLPEASTTQIRKFAPFAEIYQLDAPTRRKPIAVQIVQTLEKLGVRNLLVEGGGGLMWDFIEPGLLDEMYITLTPRILGGSQSPSLVDGKGFTPENIVNLKLKSCQRKGDELYLVYSRIKKRGP